jgi:prepilin-type N-terminal cleavage/methylation domain-containing protein
MSLSPRRKTDEKTRPSIHSFTLIELLVAMTVLSLIMVILFQIFNESTRAWAIAERRVDAYREARAALYIISQDLHSMVVTNTCPFYVNATAPPVQPPVGAEPGSIFFINALPAQSQESGQNQTDLCSVGYYLVYTTKSTFNPKKTFKLYRHLLSSNPTFTNIILNKLFINSDYTIPNPANDEVLAENVFNLKFEAYDTNGVVQDPWPNAQERPTGIKLSLWAYNRDTSQKLPDDKNSWFLTNNPLQKANLQEFKTIVKIPEVR